MAISLQYLSCLRSLRDTGGVGTHVAISLQNLSRPRSLRDTGVVGTHVATSLRNLTCATPEPILRMAHVRAVSADLVGAP